MIRNFQVRVYAFCSNFFRIFYNKVSANESPPNVATECNLFLKKIFFSKLRLVYNHLYLFYLRLDKKEIAQSEELRKNWNHTNGNTQNHLSEGEAFIPNGKSTRLDSVRSIDYESVV